MKWRSSPDFHAELNLLYQHCYMLFCRTINNTVLFEDSRHMYSNLLECSDLYSFPICEFLVLKDRYMDHLSNICLNTRCNTIYGKRNIHVVYDGTRAHLNVSSRRYSWYLSFVKQGRLVQHTHHLFREWPRNATTNDFAQTHCQHLMVRSAVISTHSLKTFYE